MKALFIVGGIFFMITQLNSQTVWEKTKEKAKEKTEQRRETRTDEAIDKGLDKVEKGIKGIFKKKKKKNESENKETKETANDNETTTPTTSSDNTDTTPVTPINKGFKAYSKFDFIPGEKITSYEDFSQDAVGDFPAKWSTNASGEVVTFKGVENKWLQFGNNGIFFPEFVNTLPENFTIEFDMAVTDDFSEMQSGLKLYFTPVSNRNLMFDQFFDNKPGVGIDIHPNVTNDENAKSTTKIWVFGKTENKLLENEAAFTGWKISEVNHISVWRQKTRLRIYINETKVWDLPRAFEADIQYAPLFATNIWDGSAFLANLRVAEGLPDTRNKLITEGKFVTNGILFEFQKAEVKPESYAVIKEIATVLKENPTIKIKITGHTSNDGDANANLTLSKQRAAAVQSVLTNEFGIDASRMQTDGKGGSEPVDTTNTPTGKANNRRVEFIKL
ncbi:MAG TPA: OmpA family protein [Chitinophagaceae bacterium]|nr:OmpA family protein [Chitinophagaceae bacterium]MCC6635977.1 OmpA family protein [Chitinophagaceae bacterium]HMZ45576.1 OmpA family protein [Chitinophagaceae bacterium]HNM33934.1 OmpA family protein [Chitinophagaceae bacterium]HNN30619.1 OmpA family protein [Chitinophagaceae bacterium]